MNIYSILISNRSYRLQDLKICIVGLLCKYSFRYLALIVFLIICNTSSAQCDPDDCPLFFDIPNDMVICDPSEVDLIAEIASDYSAFQWISDNGYENDEDTETQVYVDRTTTFTFNLESDVNLENLIENGDFEDGFSGFYHEVDESEYSVVVEENFFDGTTLCTGDGNVLYIENLFTGYNFEVGKIWCQSIELSEGYSYTFTFDINHGIFNGDILLDGSVLESFSYSRNRCEFENISINFCSEVSGEVELCIEVVPDFEGLALDNLELFEIPCEKEESFTVSLSEYDLAIEGDIVYNCNSSSQNLSAGISNESVSNSYRYTWSSIDGSIASRVDSAGIVISGGGTYTLITENEFGCMRTADIHVTGGTDVPMVMVQDTLIDCMRDSILLQLGSDTTDYNISWTDQAGVELFQQDSLYVSAQGWYYYDVLPAIGSGCTHRDSVYVATVTTIESISTSAAEIDCDTPMVTLSAVGGDASAMYSWTYPDGSIISGMDTEIVVDTSGLYVVSQTSERGCIYSDSIVLSSYDPVWDYSSAVPTEISCDITMVELELFYSDNYIVTWLTGDLAGEVGPVQMVICGGTYVYQLEDDRGCTIMDSVSVIEDIMMPDVDIAFGTLDCNNTSTSAYNIMDDNYSYSWTSVTGMIIQSDSLLITQEGRYTVTVTADNGCTTVSAIDVIALSDIPSAIITSDSITCSRPTVTLSADISSNVTAYEWRFPDGDTSTDVSPVVNVAGDYVLNLVTQGGCETDIIYELIEDIGPPILDPQVSGALTCQNEDVTLSQTIDNEDVEWFDSNGMSLSQSSTIITSQAGTYILVMMGDNGCIDSTEVDVMEIIPDFNYSIAYDSIITCDQSEVLLDISIDTTLYQIVTTIGNQVYNNALSIPIYNPANVEIVITDDFMCEISRSLSITEDTQQASATISYDNLDCDKPLTELQILSVENVSDIQLTFPDGMTQADAPYYIDQEGTYRLLLMSDNGCDSTIVFSVDADIDLPQVSILGDTLDCNVDEVELLITSNVAASTIQWTGPQNQSYSDISIITSEPGTYSVTLTDDQGCAGVSSYEVIEIDDELMFRVKVGTLSCSRSETYIDVEILEGDLAYFIIYDSDRNEIARGEEYEVEELAFIAEGLYAIEGLSLSGCVSMESFGVENVDDPKDVFLLEGPRIIEVMEDSSYIINVMTDVAVQDIEMISWSPDIGLSCSDCLTPELIYSGVDTYTMTLTNANGCEQSIQVEIELREDNIVTQDSVEIYIPNVININMETENNGFRIYAPTEKPVFIDYLAIFDRWGNKMYEAEAYDTNSDLHTWRGEYHDGYVEMGVYVYYVEFTIDNERYKRAGDLTLLW